MNPANPRNIILIADSKMKNNDVSSEVLAKLLRNNWISVAFVPDKDIRWMSRIVRIVIHQKRDPQI